MFSPPPRPLCVHKEAVTCKSIRFFLAQVSSFTRRGQRRVKLETWAEKSDRSRRLGRLERKKKRARWARWEEMDRAPRAFYFFDYCYFYWDTQQESRRRREPTVPYSSADYTRIRQPCVIRDLKQPRRRRQHQKRHWKMNSARRVKLYYCYSA